MTPSVLILEASWKNRTALRVKRKRRRGSQGGTAHGLAKERWKPFRCFGGRKPRPGEENEAASHETTTASRDRGQPAGDSSPARDPGRTSLRSLSLDPARASAHQPPPTPLAVRSTRETPTPMPLPSASRLPRGWHGSFVPRTVRHSPEPQPQTPAALPSPSPSAGCPVPVCSP